MSSTNPTNRRTAILNRSCQPVNGRRIPGGLKIGEMESDVARDIALSMQPPCKDATLKDVEEPFIHDLNVRVANQEFLKLLAKMNI